jgi:hypothetical protein
MQGSARKRASTGAALTPVLKKEEKERTLFTSLGEHSNLGVFVLLDARLIFQLHEGYVFYTLT